MKVNTRLKTLNARSREATDLTHKQIPIPRRRQIDPRRRQQHQQTLHRVSEVLV